MIPDYDPQNIFAKILRSEIPCKKITENQYALAFHDIHPQAPIHFLVIPKGAYVSFEDFILRADQDTQKGFHECVLESLEILQIGQNQNQNGFRVISNIGPDGGQEVPHHHLHILAGKPLRAMV